MKTIAAELDRLIHFHLPLLQKITEETWKIKPSPAKWSNKEELGHLVDSAQANIRRFVLAHDEENPFIRYNQDKWVIVCNYQHWETADIIGLWYLLNKQVCNILNNTPASLYQQTYLTDSPHTLEWLAADYVKHLLHHLHAILNLEPVEYP